MRCCTTPGRRVSGRARSTAAPAATSRTPQGIPQYCSPLSFASDNLTNNELGWKTRILRSPAAVERRDLSGKLEQRAGRVLRPGRARQPRLRHQRPELPRPRLETSFIAALTAGPDGAGRGFLEQQRADQLAVPDREQSRAAGESGQRGGIRQADPERAESVRPDRRPERQLAADSVQPARALRVDDQLLQRLRAGRRDPHRAFVHAVEHQSVAFGGRTSARRCCDSRIRRSRSTTPPSAIRRMPGSAELYAPEPDQREQEHLHLDQPVRARREDYAAAGARGRGSATNSIREAAILAEGSTVIRRCKAWAVRRSR